MAGPIKSVPESCDWEVYAGDRNRQQFQFLADDGQAPWDLTGATLRAQARLSATDPTIGLEAAVTIDDPPAGLVTIAWDGEEVRTLLAGEDSWAGEWDLELVEAGQTLPVTPLAGAFTAAMDVTKP